MKWYERKCLKVEMVALELNKIEKEKNKLQLIGFTPRTIDMLSKTSTT